MYRQLLLSAALVSNAAFSYEYSELGGSFGLSYQSFFSDPLYSYQDDQQSLEFIAEPKATIQVSEDVTLKFRGFYRGGASDAARNHADIREFLLEYSGSSADVAVGIGKVFWGVTESRHVVDIINQSDFVERFDGEEKLGQPLLNVSFTRSWGTLSMYWLPYFRPRPFLSQDGRFQTQPPINNSSNAFKEGRDNKHRDFALRYSVGLDDIDLGLAYVDGYQREPDFLAVGNAAYLTPSYHPIQRVSADIQYTSDSLLLKFEGVHQKEGEKFYSTMVTGLEYGVYQVADSAADIALFMEYLYSDRGLGEDAIFDDDLFLGARLEFNDVGNSSVMLGGISDLNNGELIVRAEVSTRIGSSWTVELTSFLFERADASLASYRNDSYVELGVKYNF